MGSRHGFYSFNSQSTIPVSPAGRGDLRRPIILQGKTTDQIAEKNFRRKFVNPF
jgi:hypothetical protein